MNYRSLYFIGTCKYWLLFFIRLKDYLLYYTGYLIMKSAKTKKIRFVFNARINDEFLRILSDTFLNYPSSKEFPA
mgnify:CR=1 FL=1